MSRQSERTGLGDDRAGQPFAEPEPKREDSLKPTAAGDTERALKVFRHLAPILKRLQEKAREEGSQ
jgi:hypothetical protein